MVEEVLAGLNPAKGDLIVDATVGGGGHARWVLERICPGGMLLGIDRDIEALQRSADTLREFEGSVFFAHGNFRNIDAITAQRNIKKVDGVLFDLGVSMDQLGSPSRGFSFIADAPLDMRMDRSSRVSAQTIVNRYPEKELFQIIATYGEERFARRIARAIVYERKRKPIRTTGRLEDIVRRSIRSRPSGQKINPATRTFQAIRIAVNDELRSMREGLEKAIDLLKPDGRVCVISFHSLEDRIAKTTFRKFKKEGKLEVVTKKPMQPSEEEKRINPRARSAKLRIAVRKRKDL